MRPSRIAAPLIAFALSGSPALAQMNHPPGMSHAQVVAAASRGAPESVSRNAAIAWVDSTGTLHQMRPGTNGFTCVLIVPDPLGGPVCGDQIAAAWLMAFLTGQQAPPAQTAPGIAYMAAGGAHYEDAQGNVLMEHDRSPHAAGSRRVTEGPHWMLIYPLDPATTGLPTRENAGGTYIMYAGTPWAHVMIYQDPSRMAAPMQHH